MSITSLEPTEDYWPFFCEGQSRWSAALRVELVQHGRPEAAMRIRSSDDAALLETLPAESPPVLLGLEVTPMNLQQRLKELARWRKAPAVCPVGLICGDLFARDELPRVAEVLSEAGAQQTLASPLKIGQLVGLADRHAAVVWRHLKSLLPPHELVWRRLPWQSPPWEIG